MFNTSVCLVNAAFFIVGASFSYFLLQLWQFRKEPLLKKIYLKKSKIFGIITTLLIAAWLFLYNRMPETPIEEIGWLSLVSGGAGLIPFAWRKKMVISCISLIFSYCSWWFFNLYGVWHWNYYGPNPVSWVSNQLINVMKLTSVVLAVLSLTFSIIALRKGPWWLRIITFLLALFVCFTILNLKNA